MIDALFVVSEFEQTGPVGTPPAGVDCADVVVDPETEPEPTAPPSAPVDDPEPEPTPPSDDPVVDDPAPTAPGPDAPWEFVSESGQLSMLVPDGWSVEAAGFSDCMDCEIHTWSYSFVDAEGVTMLELEEGALVHEGACSEPGYDGGGFGPSLPMASESTVASTAWFPADGGWGAIAQVAPNGTDVLCTPYAGSDPAVQYSAWAPHGVHATEADARAWAEGEGAAFLAGVLATITVTG